MAIMSEKQQQNMAKMAFRYDAKENLGSGLARKSEPNCYGKLIKYLMFERGFTFKSFAECLGTSPQNLNHCLNRQKTKNFRMEDFDKYCMILRFDKDDFMKIAEIIRKMETENGTK